MKTALEKLTKLRIDLQSIERPKQPRHYSDEILLLKTKEERREALEKVPEDMRSIVRFYVHDYFAKRHKKTLPDLKESP